MSLQANHHNAPATHSGPAQQQQQQHLHQQSAQPPQADSTQKKRSAFTSDYDDEV